MAFEVTGKLIEIYNAQQVSERFTKREFVLEIQDGAYAQFIKFQANNDRARELDPYQPGDEVKVSFNLSGRPFTGRDGTQQYFTNLVAWRVDRASGNAAPSGQGSYQEPYRAPAAQQPAAPAANNNFSDSDDLPF